MTGDGSRKKGWVEEKQSPPSSKAQTSPTCTQPIQDTVRSWVRDKRAWFGDGERGKTYFEVPTWTLFGEVSCWNDIPPKRSKVKLEPLCACHEG